jgi:hypothetical protein
MHSQKIVGVLPYLVKYRAVQQRQQIHHLFLSSGECERDRVPMHRFYRLDQFHASLLATPTEQFREVASLPWHIASFDVIRYDGELPIRWQVTMPAWVIRHPSLPGFLYRSGHDTPIIRVKMRWKMIVIIHEDNNPKEPTDGWHDFISCDYVLAIIINIIHSNCYCPLKLMDKVV